MGIYPFMCHIVKTGVQESITVQFSFYAYCIIHSAVCLCVSYTPRSSKKFTGLLIDFRCSCVCGGVRDDCGGGEGLAVWRTRHSVLQSKETEVMRV